jgi:hypothetical protein
VINWITPWLATADVQGACTVKNVNGFPVLHLVDGYNDPGVIVQELMKMLQNLDRPLVIYDACGISRCNGMATLLLAYLNHTSWEDAYLVIKAKVPKAVVNPNFARCCSEALKILEKSKPLT